MLIPFAGFALSHLAVVAFGRRMLVTYMRFAFICFMTLPM